METVYHSFAPPPGSSRLLVPEGTLPELVDELVDTLRWLSHPEKSQSQFELNGKKNAKHVFQTTNQYCVLRCYDMRTYCWEMLRDINHTEYFSILK